MALPLINNAESQSSGTTATAANTGGTNANAFDIVSSDANGSITFDNTHVGHGNTAFKITQTGTTGAVQYLEWNSTSIGAAVATINVVFYAYWTTMPPNNTHRLGQFLNGSTLAGYIRGPTSGTSTMQFGTSGDVALGTAGGALSVNTLYRIDVTVTGGASGSGTIKVYAGDNLTTAVSDASFSATSFGTTFDKFRLGQTTAASTAAFSFWLDDIKLYTDSYPTGPGPYFFPAVILPDNWVAHPELGPGDYGPNPFIEVPAPLSGATTFLQDLTATVTTTASIVAAKIFALALTATATTTATIIKQVNKIMSATAPTTASMVRQVNKILSATATTTATVVKQVNKNLAATSTTTATLAAIKVILKTITATVTTTATISRSIGKQASATATTTATMSRQVGKQLTTTATSTATIAKKVAKTLATTVSSTASLVAQFIAGGAITYITGRFTSRPAGQSGDAPAEHPYQSGPGGQTGSSPSDSDYDAPHPGGQ